MDSLSLSKFNEYVNYNEPAFICAVAYSLLCFAGWVILPHLQFRYKLLSRLTGGNEGVAADFLAFFLIYTGTLRNEAIHKAMTDNIHLNYGPFEIPLQIIAYLMIIVGSIFVIMSFYRLGLRGMYFGDHFGFLFKERITQFPYNCVDNAQYVGTTTLFIGLGISHHSPAGIFIAVLIDILYRILWLVEQRKLKVFYPDSTDTKKKD